MPGPTRWFGTLGKGRGMNVLETFGLGVRYGQTWAVRDCTLAIPEGRIVALVGSNGAGKTTLLHCAVGLTEATCGRVSVLGDLPAGSIDALDRGAFVAQDAAPLPASVGARDGRSGGQLEPALRSPFAAGRLRSLDIPMKRRVGKLSGGQQAQLALTLALGRHPDLLILDEPLARLDPVADYLVLMAQGHLQLVGPIDGVLAEHAVLN